MMPQPAPIPGKWYVLDRFPDESGLIVSGPFDTFAEAEKDRREWNCADDYFVSQRVQRWEAACDACAGKGCSACGR